jgi:uncharacterized OB-fold protein
MTRSDLWQTRGNVFTDGLAKGVLRYQWCVDCGASLTLTRYACTRCGSQSLEWRDAAGTGTVYARTLVSRPPSDEFRALARIFHQ